MKKLSDHITEGFSEDTNAEANVIVETNVVAEGDDKNDDKDKVDENGNPIAEASKEGDDNIDESLINEGLGELISELSTDQIQLLMGIVGAAGIVLSAATYSSVVDKLKKSSNPTAKKIIDKLEAWGKIAAHAA